MKKHTNLKPWRPGQSGNPGGRPKSLLGSVRDVCGNNGQRIVEALALIAFGTQTELRRQFGRSAASSTKDRLTALRELADRGFGRTISEATSGAVDQLEKSESQLPAAMTEQRIEVLMVRTLEAMPEERLQRVIDQVNAARTTSRLCYRNGRLKPMTEGRSPEVESSTTDQ